MIKTGRRVQLDPKKLDSDKQKLFSGQNLGRANIQINNLIFYNFLGYTNSATVAEIITEDFLLTGISYNYTLYEVGDEIVFDFFIDRNQLFRDQSAKYFQSDMAPKSQYIPFDNIKINKNQTIGFDLLVIGTLPAFNLTVWGKKL